MTLATALSRPAGSSSRPSSARPESRGFYRVRATAEAFAGRIDAANVTDNQAATVEKLSPARLRRGDARRRPRADPAGDDAAGT